MHKVVAGNYRKIGVLGSGIEYKFAGFIEYSLELIVGISVKFMISGFIEYPFPLFLLSVDVLCGGQKASN